MTDKPKTKGRPPTKRQLALLEEMSAGNRDAVFIAGNGRRRGIWWWTYARASRVVVQEIQGLLKRGLVDRISTSKFDNSAVARINAKGRRALQPSQG